MAIDIELVNVDYDYNIGEKKFDSITYIFRIPTQYKELPDIQAIAVMRNAINGLEGIMEKNYCSQEFQKEDNGHIAPPILSVGTNYFPCHKFKSLFSMHKKEHYLGSIKCSMEKQIADSGINLRVELRNSDDNKDRILEIYDDVMGIEGLTKTPVAVSKLNTMEQFRNGTYIRALEQMKASSNNSL